MEDQQSRTSRKSLLDGVRILPGKRKQSRHPTSSDEESLLYFEEALQIDNDDSNTQTAAEIPSDKSSKGKCFTGSVNVTSKDRSDLKTLRDKKHSGIDEDGSLEKSECLVPREQEPEIHIQLEEDDASQTAGQVREPQKDETPSMTPTYRIESKKIFGIKRKMKLNKMKRKAKEKKTEQLEMTLEEEEVAYHASSSNVQDPERIEILEEDAEEKKEKKKKRRKKAKRMVKKAGKTVWKGVREGWKMMWSGLSMYTSPLGFLDVTTSITKVWTTYSTTNK